jgi:hypothetical protein
MFCIGDSLNPKGGLADLRIVGPLQKQITVICICRAKLQPMAGFHVSSHP